MRKILFNLYKRRDIFCCDQEAHKEFNGRVSVYHVLKEKKCYPQGCIYFIWHCILLQKGQRCIKGYNYVGKNCKGCTYYNEEKIHLQPSLSISNEAYNQFLEEFEAFESWLGKHEYRQVPVAGRIRTIKPWFERRIQSGETHTRVHGYILVIKNGYIGTDWFRDTLYIRVSEGLMQKYRFVPKMKLELRGELREDRGRIVIHKPKQIEVIKPGWGRPFTKDRALVGLKTGSTLDVQSDQCLDCRWGALIDVHDQAKRQERRYRQLHCSKGVPDPVVCPYGPLMSLKKHRKK